MENLVEIKDVNFAYDVRPVLRGINMTVPRGKIVAIMGLSGCGKTTVLRMISGVLKPDSGTVKVGGRIVSELDQQGLYAMRRKMGMLFQFGALFTDMSVLDNVAFQMREHTALPESMILDLALMKLHAVGLRGAQHKLPSELSGGMARRVALARAIALDPMLIM
jgi:phospholipid/cholesterol/gamma-HCH transport system ATP-binding protein